MPKDKPSENGHRRPTLVPRSSKVPAQDSDYLTTAFGQRLSHTDDSLKVGDRGPTLMEDFHLREKIMHFDHERIPERVVHARGAGVHGVSRFLQLFLGLLRHDVGDVFERGPKLRAAV